MIHSPMTIVYDIYICFNYQRHIVVEASNHSWVKRKHSISKTNLDRKRNISEMGMFPKKSTLLVYVRTIILLRLILKLMAYMAYSEAERKMGEACA